MNTRRGAEEANRESSAAGTSRDHQEVKDRLRRMETRLVTLCTNLGYETVRKKPTTTWPGCEVLIPSAETSIADILEAIPVEHRNNTFRIKHKGQVLALINWVKP